MVASSCNKSDWFFVKVFDLSRSRDVFEVSDAALTSVVGLGTTTPDPKNASLFKGQSVEITTGNCSDSFRLKRSYKARNHLVYHGLALAKLTVERTAPSVQRPI